MTIEAAQQLLTEMVMSLPGVLGTAIGDCAGSPCIKIMVMKRSDAIDHRIPSTFHGYTVSIVETGEFRALDSS